MRIIRAVFCVYIAIIGFGIPTVWANHPYILILVSIEEDKLFKGDKVCHKVYWEQKRHDYKTGTTDIFGKKLRSTGDDFSFTSDGGEVKNVEISGKTQSGIARWTGGILPFINYSFEFTGAPNNAKVTGEHDGYPSYRIYENGRLIYYYKHKPSSWISPQQLKLFGTSDRRVKLGYTYPRNPLPNSDEQYPELCKDLLVLFSADETKKADPFAGGLPSVSQSDDTNADETKKSDPFAGGLPSISQSNDTNADETKKSDPFAGGLPSVSQPDDTKADETKKSDPFAGGLPSVSQPDDTKETKPNEPDDTNETKRMSADDARKKREEEQKSADEARKKSAEEAKKNLKEGLEENAENIDELNRLLEELAPETRQDWNEDFLFEMK